MDTLRAFDLIKTQICSAKFIFQLAITKYWESRWSELKPELEKAKF